MSDLAAKHGAVPAAKKALFLVFHIGNERYALKATEVAEVLPRLPLKPLAHAPLWVAGIFAHRGAMAGADCGAGHRNPALRPGAIQAIRSGQSPGALPGAGARRCLGLDAMD